MAQIELSLDVSPTNNSRVIRLYDTSSYSNLPVENYLIEVLPVNKDRWVVFHVGKDWSLVLNSSNLKYKKASSEDDLISLPDGVYEIKQSVKPNNFTVQHFYHFRITQLANKVNKQRAILLDDKCTISRAEFVQNRDKIRDIEEYLDAAKWMVEECLDKRKGKELYEFASKKLEEYTNECQCQ